MRKAITLSLAAAFLAAAGGRVAMAADRAGIGYEWGMGPKFSLATGFDMKMEDSSALSWQVTDDFQVSVFRSAGTFRGTHEYKDTIASPAVSRTVELSGDEETDGLAFSARLPMLTFLNLGIELGTVTFNEIGPGSDSHMFTSSDGSWASSTMFGSSYDLLNGTAAMEGITAKAVLLKAENKAITTGLGVAASLRFVQFPGDKYIYGHQEVASTSSPLKGIDPISSINSFDIKLFATIGF